MKKICLIFLTIISIQCSSSVEPEKREDRFLTEFEKEIANSSGRFGFNIFNKINKSEVEKNIFISPLSISVALGMALNGADGTTYDSMQAVLDFSGLSPQQINESYQSLTNLLTSVDPQVTFQLANSIWYKHSLSFEQEFIDLNKEYFNASVTPLDFTDPNSVNIINNWCSKNTNGKIEKMLEMIPPDAIMYLLNAVYFNGTWKFEFNKENTIDSYFNSVNGSVACKQMVQSNDFSYLENEIFQAVNLPYGNGNFNMAVILPKDNIDVDEIINQTNSENWDVWQKQFSENKGTLMLPKFKLEYEIKLNDVLKAMGMSNAFDPARANFKKLYSGNAFISRVKHKTFVEVDEEGTEAAAVTLVEFRETSSNGGGEKNFIMDVNRPFIFTIHEKNSGTILFVGKVVNPTL